VECLCFERLNLGVDERHRVSYKRWVGYEKMLLSKQMQYCTKFMGNPI